MTLQYKDIKTVAKKIEAVGRGVIELRTTSDGVSATNCNSERVLASIKMLETNASDVAGRS